MAKLPQASKERGASKEALPKGWQTALLQKNSTELSQVRREGSTPDRHLEPIISVLPPWHLGTSISCPSKFLIPWDWSDHQEGGANLLTPALFLHLHVALTSSNWTCSDCSLITHFSQSAPCTAHLKTEERGLRCLSRLNEFQRIVRTFEFLLKVFPKETMPRRATTLCCSYLAVGVILIRRQRQGCDLVQYSGWWM